MIKKNGITLISLVITIVVLIILTSVIINVTLGKNGIIDRVKDAKMEYKKSQYFEDINLEIIDEQTERSIKQKNELFITSIEHRLAGTPTASAASTKAYTKKEWIEKVTNSLNKTLFVDTTDGYQLFIDFDNANNTATIREDSFEKTDNQMYKITYNANNGTEATVESDSARKGLSIKIQENPFNRKNYTFLRWCENPDGTGKEYEVGDEYLVTGDITLYAKWSQHAITIKYEANGGDGEMPDQNKEIGEEITLSTRFTRTGYTFNGWKDQNNDTYEENKTITAKKDLTLTAQWKTINYAIEYTLNEGNVSTSNPTTYTAETDTFTLYNPTKTGYTFVGWTGSNGETPQITVTIEEGTIGNKAYTANWTATSYTISYTLNEGSISAQPTSYTIESNNFTIPTPTKSQWTFTGWTGTGLSSSTKSVTVSKGNTGDRSYTAHWEKTLCNFSWSGDNPSYDNTWTVPESGTLYGSLYGCMWEFRLCINGASKMNLYWSNNNSTMYGTANYVVNKGDKIRIYGSGGSRSGYSANLKIIQ